MSISALYPFPQPIAGHARVTLAALLLTALVVPVSLIAAQRSSTATASPATLSRSVPAQPLASAGRSSAAGSVAVPSGLQAAIDRTLAHQSYTSKGVTLDWGKKGAVSFTATSSHLATTLRPVSIGRSVPKALDPGSFVFAAKKTNESLGQGVSAWYSSASSGFEQGFTVARRPAGASDAFALDLAFSGAMHATVTSAVAVALSDANGTVLTYGGLKVTDAARHQVAAHLAVVGHHLQIIVNDAHARYPLTIDPYVAPATTPVDTLTGPSSGLFGAAVALSADGSVALVGTPGAGSDLGAAYIYEESDGSWASPTLVATMSASSSALLGSAVALSADGSVALVGAPAVSSDKGATYIYEESAGSWSATPTAVATMTGASGTELGSSAALSSDGSVALVGAPGAGAGVGTAHIYEESAGSWSATPTAVATMTGASNADFGHAVALSAAGSVAFVGADGAGSHSGAGYIYEESGGSWSATPTAVASMSGTTSTQLGGSVALSADGTVALVGAAFGGTDNGAAYIYEESAGSWSATPTPIATMTGVPSAELGGSVALSSDGTVALVGAPGAGSDKGAAYVYAESEGSWAATPTAVATMTGSGSGIPELGSSVTLSADGSVALVGTHYAASESGTASLYEAPASLWSATPAAVATATGSSGSALGTAVAQSANGRVALVGASGAGGGNGAAYIYEESAGSWSANPTAVATMSGSSFEELGSAVALSADGSVALVGAENAGSANGAAYIYKESAESWSANPTAVATMSGSSTSELGTTVALSADGSVALVGAEVASGNGAAYIYEESAGSWSATPAAVARMTGSVDAGLGTSVALSADGSVALVGAPGAGSDNGAAYIYEKSAGLWSATPAAVATMTGSAGAVLGSAVALSGDGSVALVGAWGAGSANGAAYIYKVSAGSWSATPAAVATMSGSSTSELGTAVALSADGSVALVGASGAGSANGAAYIYEESAGSWSATPAAVATMSGSSDALLGSAVALSADGSVGLVGAAGASGNGAAFIYDALTTQSALTISPSSTTTGTGDTVGFTASGGSDAGTVTYALDTGTNGHTSSGTCALTGATASATGTGTCYVSAMMAGNTTYAPATSTDATVTFTSSGTTAQLTFTISPSSTTTGTGDTVGFTASGGSDAGTVTYALDTGTNGHTSSGTCALTGATASATGTGTCYVSAMMAGNTTYAPVTSTDATVTFTSSGTTAQLTLTISSATTSTISGNAVAFTASGGSDSGAVSYNLLITSSGVCALSGSMLSASGAGTCHVTATMAGNTTYAPVSSTEALVTFTAAATSTTTVSVQPILPLPSTIPLSGFGAPVAIVLTAAPGTVSASSSSASTQVTIAAGALPTGTTVDLFGEANPAAFASSLANNDALVNAFGLDWTTPSGAIPTPSSPIAVTVTDATIAPGDIVYVMTPSGPVKVAVATVAGSVTFTTTSEGAYVVVAPPMSSAASTGTPTATALSVKLICSSGRLCSGSSQVSVARVHIVNGHKRYTHLVLATATYSVTGGTVGSIHLRLTTAGKRLLGHLGKGRRFRVSFVTVITGEGRKTVSLVVR